jgi:hypothetical protein
MKRLLFILSLCLISFFYNTYAVDNKTNNDLCKRLKNWEIGYEHGKYGKKGTNRSLCRKNSLKLLCNDDYQEGLRVGLIVKNSKNDENPFD